MSVHVHDVRDPVTAIILAVLCNRQQLSIDIAQRIVAEEAYRT